MGRLSRKFRPVQVVGARRVRLLNNIAGGVTDIAEGEGIVITAGAAVKIGDNNTAGIHGIACADIPAGAIGEMYVEGVFEAEVNGTVNFAQGDPVYCAGNQKVDAGSQHDVALGYIVGSDPVSGATLVEFVLRSAFNDSKTHA
jgi:predicted RecA/RadA family phage recombinase